MLLLFTTTSVAAKEDLHFYFFAALNFSLLFQNYELSYGHYVKFPSWQISPPGSSPGRILNSATAETPERTETGKPEMPDLATSASSRRSTWPSCRSFCCCTIQRIENERPHPTGRAPSQSTTTSASALTFKTFLLFYCLTSSILYNKPDHLIIGITNHAWICLDEVPNMAHMFCLGWDGDQFQFKAQFQASEKFEF